MKLIHKYLLDRVDESVRTFVGFVIIGLCFMGLERFYHIDFSEEKFIIQTMIVILCSIFASILWHAFSVGIDVLFSTSILIIKRAWKFLCSPIHTPHV